MSHIEDRVYVILNGALHQNEDPEKRYFYDRSDGLIFYIYFRDGVFDLSYGSYNYLSAKTKKILELKVSKINTSHKDIFEIHSLPDRIKIDYDQSQPKTGERYQRLNQLGLEQFEKTQKYVHLHGIDISKSDTIQ